MTIAMCYQSPEGIVLGADSTSSTIITPGPGLLGFHYFNYNQKLFELHESRECGTIGALTWGLGNVGAKSHRTMLALLTDDIRTNAPNNIGDIAARWATRFWDEYSVTLSVQIQETKDLAAKTPYDPNTAPPDPASRSKDQEDPFLQPTISRIRFFRSEMRLTSFMPVSTAR